MVGMDNDGYPVDYSQCYLEDVEAIREREYPLLKDTTYLDHAGTTLYARSLVDSFSQELTANLFGNPHSMSASSQLSTQRVDDIRLRALRFFNADPEHFDLVFVANATAGIKLVADALRDSDPRGFRYGYHVEAHTSLVGARELAQAGCRCFTDDQEVETWIQRLGHKHGENDDSDTPELFAFPAQSNMNGRRFPLRWCGEIRNKMRRNVYTLLDAASLVSTSPLDLGDPSTAPDFTVLSFYKIFGLPDLGALIVRKDSAGVFDKRRFFGGGTVDMVLAREDMQWHAKKQASIHEKLEDGTLPFHNIIALGCAFKVHERLYGSIDCVSSHTRFLAQQLHARLDALTHFNGAKVCYIYMHPDSNYDDPATQGPILAFNLRDSQGGWIGKSLVERLASVKDVQIRSGTLCNPGGTASSLGWSGKDMRRNFSAGLRCGDDHDLMDGRPTGILRVSLGAMSSLKDIDSFVNFVEEFYLEKEAVSPSLSAPMEHISSQSSGFYIESVSVYPIKSCGAFKVPAGQRWEIRKEGLAWDREWCLIHQGTGATLNQKRYPRMALIHPYIDVQSGVLRITCSRPDQKYQEEEVLEISLDRESTNKVTTSLCQNTSKPSTVCGDQVIVQAYTSPTVSAFFSNFLEVPCTLARFPPQPDSKRSASQPETRRTQFKKPASSSTGTSTNMPGSFPQDITSYDQTLTQNQSPLLLSNESPILIISRSSVNHLNEAIKAQQQQSKAKAPSTTRKAVAADVFRANIIVAENTNPSHLNHSTSTSPSSPTVSHDHQYQHQHRPEHPYIEDTWTSLTIHPALHSTSTSTSHFHSHPRTAQINLDILGPCQRCQMVCVDPSTGVRGDEPFSTLAKTRKMRGGVFFGRHAGISPASTSTDAFGSDVQGVMVGDVVVPVVDGTLS